MRFFGVWINISIILYHCTGGNAHCEGMCFSGQTVNTSLRFLILQVDDPLLSGQKETLHSPSSVFRAKLRVLSASTWALFRARVWPRSSPCQAHGRGSLHGSLLNVSMIRSLFGEVWKADLNREVCLLWGNGIPLLGTPLFWNLAFKTKLGETEPIAHLGSSIPEFPA